MYIVLIPCKDLEAMKHTFTSKRIKVSWNDRRRTNLGGVGSIPARDNLFFFSDEACGESHMPCVVVKCLLDN